MFDVGLGEMVVLVVLALVISGDRLPQAARQTGRVLRQLRQVADSARADLKEGLGPEFGDVDLADLNPRTFVRKHLLEQHDDPSPGAGHEPADEPSRSTTGDQGPHTAVPFDREAT